MIDNLADKRVTVMGLGLFGGGVGVVNFLLSKGALVTVTDLRTAEALESSLQMIPVDKLEKTTFGEHQDQDFLNADLIVVSPAVPAGENRFLQLARDRGIPLTSEIALFWSNCAAKKIVVTGTVGKSTTALLIHTFLVNAGIRSTVGGNLGGSLLHRVSEMTSDEYVVLELSSFQLAALAELKIQPDVSVVTNFAPNHIDWHQTLDHYRESKQEAICWQSAEQIAVLNADDPDSSLWPTDARVVWFGKEVWQDRNGVKINEDNIIVRSNVGAWKIAETDLAPWLRNEHGMANVAAALGAVTVGLEISLEKFGDMLSKVQGLDHRFERLESVQGRDLINDSKATTPESTLAALNNKAITTPLILIAGGKDKGIDLDALAKRIAERAKAVALIGETAGHLKDMILEYARGTSLNAESVRVLASLPEAFDWAWGESREGDTILLSPACASHGEFTNYEQRGRCFVECAAKLRG
ncbi:UDP-N-acetylmuramoyl-L-alanine--D-glutamate ligase [Planctomicrobium sp. SH668]|uniref:UDP-N-acetylmuramoyl-L-alanine--D-glutamate ligase n=1 Tax=Planctomicrobium sp. SH668 TaxID=3448126 RepID=UPI003F5CA3CB